MKKALSLTIVLLMLSVTTVFADDIFENTDLGAKISAPNIIKLAENHAIGAEVSITDITNDWNDGSQAYIVYTYSGSLFNLSK